MMLQKRFNETLFNIGTLYYSYKQLAVADPGLLDGGGAGSQESDGKSVCGRKLPDFKN